jgi:hypothetical protein
LARETKTDLQDEELQFRDVIRMHPIFGCLSNEIALASTSRTVALDWITPRSHDIKQSREFDNIRIIVILEEGAFLESSCERRLENPSGFFL